MAIYKEKVEAKRVIKNSNSTTRVQMIVYAQRFSDQFGKAQKFIDSEIMRRCEPYTPKRTNNMINSAIRATIIGKGEVVWKTPYVRKQYYNTRVGRPNGALRGSYWFERMKNTHGQQIIEAAKRIGGGED